MENVVIYARFSSHNQTEASIEGQLQVCYEYAKRNNYKVVQEYIDRAISGTTDKRPEFQRMIEDSKTRAFSYVLVYQLDRFARDRYDSATYKHKLKKNGVRVISAKENISADASGILMESVLEGMAEYYSAELAQKIKRGMKLNAEKCKSFGGQRPFGYNITEEKTFVINENEAYWVRKIFEYYAVETPVMDILDMLKKAGVKTTKDKDFTHDSLDRLLKNRRYIGEYTCGEITIPNGIPKIVDEELFNRVQKAKTRSSYKQKQYSPYGEYLLSGKLFCAECGSPIIGTSCRKHSGGKYFYYKCNRRIKKKDCILPAIPREELELSVVEAVRMQLTDQAINQIVDDALIKLNNNIERKNRVSKLKKQLTEVNEQIEKFTDLLIQSRNIDIIMNRIDELKVKQQELEQVIFSEDVQEITYTKEYLIEKIRKIRDFDYCQKNYARLFITTFVEGVYINKDKKIAVVVNIDNSLFIPPLHFCTVHNRMVELKRIELSTS